jgi:hypothetical protein
VNASPLLMLACTQHRDHAQWHVTPKTYKWTTLSTLSLSLSRRLPYRYIPLQRNQVRLLKLFPGESASQIHCSLHIVDLLSYDDRTAESSNEHLERYDAISYFWGNHKQRVEIICKSNEIILIVGCNRASLPSLSSPQSSCS